MKTITIPISYDQSISTTPAALFGISSGVLLLVISSVILIKSFSLDKK